MWFSMVWQNRHGHGLARFHCFGICRIFLIMSSMRRMCFTRVATKVPFFHCHKCKDPALQISYSTFWLSKLRQNLQRFYGFRLKYNLFNFGDYSLVIFWQKSFLFLQILLQKVPILSSSLRENWKHIFVNSFAKNEKN